MNASVSDCFETTRLLGCSRELCGRLGHEDPSTSAEGCCTTLLRALRTYPSRWRKRCPSSAGSLREASTRTIWAVLYRVALACGHLKEGAISARDVGVLRLKLWEGSGAESLESSGCVRVVAKGEAVRVSAPHEELRVTQNWHHGIARIALVTLKVTGTRISQQLRPDTRCLPRAEVSQKQGVRSPALAGWLSQS